MTKQLTIPPPYVWDRIEKILDEQEYERKHTAKLISNTLYKSGKARYTNYFFAIVTGAGVLAFIMLKSPAGFKN